MPTKQEIRESGVLPLSGKTVFLREIALSDVGERYLGWMNDFELNRYLESRFGEHTMKSLADFVGKRLESDTEWMFAICAGQIGQHIGNIKLGPVNARHGFGEIGLLVGEKDWHGKGVATEAIGLVSGFAFDVLGLHKLTAGMYAANVGSRRAFEKCGFQLEGTLRQQYLCDGKYMDCYRLGLLKEGF